MTKHSAAADAELTATAPASRTLFELQPAETIIMTVRPAVVRQLLADNWRYGFPAAILLALAIASPPSALAFSRVCFCMAIVCAVAPLAIHTDRWLRRRYILTDRRVIALQDPFVINELPLTAVRRVELEANRAQSTLNIGDVAFHADSAAAVRWQGVPDAAHLRQAARDVIRRYARGALEE